MTVPPVGSPAPGFTLPDQDGNAVSLSSFAGGAGVALVFYPFAFSGICTAELCALRDDPAVFGDAGVEVLAISCDPRWSLKAYAQAQGYAFRLLSDFWPHGEVASAYGVFDPDAGRAQRGTFLVDSEGTIRWSVVNPPGQARALEEYRAAVAELVGG
ncbi:MAG: peroxiredoxin [Kineosporiaceae bacterium]